VQYSGVQYSVVECSAVECVVKGMTRRTWGF
jgi:hypothetical protein